MTIRWTITVIRIAGLPGSRLGCRANQCEAWFDTATEIQSCYAMLSIRAEKGSQDMFEVTVEATFSSGHFLRNYEGKCENPHGHNYRVYVTLVGRDLDEAGMLIDFKLLKQILRPTVEYLDHKMINDLEPFVSEINPSAENLARYFFERARLSVRGMTSGRVSVKDCTVYETDTSFARYYDESASARSDGESAAQ
jgi:6-pyruvoyltetrahydropterin/6-carboxytetrahydropterin synthase